MEFGFNLLKCQNVVVSVQQCNFITAMLYLHNNIFLADIIGCACLKFRYIYSSMKSWLRHCNPDP